MDISQLLWICWLDNLGQVTILHLDYSNRLVVFDIDLLALLQDVIHHYLTLNPYPSCAFLHIFRK